MLAALVRWLNAVNTVRRLSLDFDSILALRGSRAAKMDGDTEPDATERDNAKRPRESGQGEFEDGLVNRAQSTRSHGEAVIDVERDDDEHGAEEGLDADGREIKRARNDAPILPEVAAAAAMDLGTVESLAGLGVNVYSQVCMLVSHECIRPT